MKLPKHNGIVNTRYRFGMKTGLTAFVGPIKMKTRPLKACPHANQGE
jgi:hypothetical protein